MAITIDDFSKIWASTSPLTPYEFNESNYKEGWNFIGGTPPSRQMWDFLQKNNDEKSKFLLDKFGEYLPLSGGTMTGNITLADGGNPLSTSGGTMTGAIKGNPVTLTADDENGNSADLVLNADGSATLDGSNIITSALTGNVLSAYGTSTTENTEATLCSISTHDAGVWLIIGFVDLNYNGTVAFYINKINTENHGFRGTRTTPAAGGGSINIMLESLSENELISLQGFQQQAGTMRGSLLMVRLA